MINITNIRVYIFALLCFWQSHINGAEKKTDDTKSTILMIDDHHILYRSGTKRNLKPLVRHSSRPLIGTDKPWETTIAYCSVYRNSITGKYQLWYQAWPGKSGCYLCYAESNDGIKWTKPSLGLVDYKGSKDNNILLINGYGASIIYDKTDPNAQKRYKAAFWEQDTKKGIEFPGTCIAFSADGINWKKHSNNPVIKGSYGDYIQPPIISDLKKINAQEKPLSTSDVIDLIWDPKKESYAIYAKTWLDGPKGNMHWKRAVVRTESTNFINWTKPKLVMVPDEFDGSGGEQDLARTAGGGGSDGVQLHSGPAFFYNDLYFSMLQVMDSGNTGNMPIELALSRDGDNWKRPFRNKWFIPPLDNKEIFDASLIWSNATPIFLKDVFRFYYGAYGKPWNSSDGAQISGIGLAEMPRNRFGGIEPIERFGQITLRSIELNKVKGIEINGDATNGSIRPEILSDDGYRIPGYTKNDVKPLQTDSLKHQVKWNQKKIRDLPSGQYKLRLHLENAEIFAITIRY